MISAVLKKPFHRSIVDALQDAGTAKCRPCLLALAKLSMLTIIPADERIIFDMLVRQATHIGILDQYAILAAGHAIMLKDLALVASTFGISKSVVDQMTSLKRNPYHVSIVIALDEARERAAFLTLADLLGKTEILRYVDQEPIVTALKTAADRFDLGKDDRIVTAAVALTEDFQMVASRFDVELARVRTIHSGLVTTKAPASTTETSNAAIAPASAVRQDTTRGDDGRRRSA